MTVSKQTIFVILAVSLLCLVVTTAGRSQQNPFPQAASLKDARRGFHTQLVPQKEPKQPVDKAPPTLFRMIKYPSQVGELAAYLSPDPRDGAKHPAIVWITGGDCNSLSSAEVNKLFTR